MDNLSIDNNDNMAKSEYRELPPAHWKIFTQGKYNPGIVNVQPVVEMLSDIPYPRLTISEKEFTKQIVLYDAEYVYEYFFKKLVNGMGFVSPAGILNEELLSAFLQELLVYSKGTEERKRLVKLEADAEKLAKEYPHMTREQWFLFLQQSQDAKKVDDVETPPTNKKPRATKKDEATES